MVNTEEALDKPLRTKLRWLLSVEVLLRLASKPPPLWSSGANHSSLLSMVKDKLEDMDVSLYFQTRHKGPITFSLNISKTI